MAIGITAVALFGVGATLSLFTGRSAWLSGARMLALGALAGRVTFVIGRLFGVATLTPAVATAAAGRGSARALPRARRAR